jgi:uncharacterized damage-inducible protein DinB
MVNADMLTNLRSVVESLKDEHLSYRPDNVKVRTIGELVSHILCTQECYYTNELVLEREEECTCSSPNTVKEALRMIDEYEKRILDVWGGISVSELMKEFDTEWGQRLSKELALFQSIEHSMHHIGQICLIASIGGFYKNVLG